MSFIKTTGFKYFKNLIIGVGASVVMIGALVKITSDPWGGIHVSQLVLLQRHSYLLSVGLLDLRKRLLLGKTLSRIGQI